MLISEQQVARYQDQGFLVVEFNADNSLKYEKKNRSIKFGHALHQLDPVFARFSRSRKVKELTKAIRLENSLLLTGSRKGQHTSNGALSRGMRIRVIDVLDLFAAGLTSEQIPEEMPDLETEDLKAALQYAARKLEHPVLAA
jgi:uncharacterized protein (DUF433 family)